MHKLSIIGADYHSEEDVVGYYNTGDRMRSWGKNGAFLGRNLGCLFWVGVLRHSRDRTARRSGTSRRRDRLGARGGR